MNRKAALSARVSVIFFAASMLITALMFVMLAQKLNVEDSRLAFDWKIYWNQVENGKVHEGMSNPPWTMIVLLPFGLLPLNAGWGLMMFLLLAVLVISVPPRASGRQRALVVVLLVTAYPVMRHYADGNIEGFSLGGVLLLLYAYRARRPVLFALGALLSTIKPQSTYLLLLVMALYAYQTMPRRSLYRIGAVLLAVMIPTSIWKGKFWIDTVLHYKTDYGISLHAVWLPALPAGLVLAVRLLVVGLSLYAAYRGNRQMSYAKAGMLVTASILVSPYSQMLSVIPVLAIGVMPLVVDRPRIGLPLFLLYDVAYFSLATSANEPSDHYWNIVLLLTWGILLWTVYHAEFRARPTETAVAVA